MNLWRYNTVTGYWVFERDTSPDTADAWLRLFQRDEPNAYFKLAKTKPRQAPSMRSAP